MAYAKIAMHKRQHEKEHENEHEKEYEKEHSYGPIRSNKDKFEISIIFWIVTFHAICNIMRTYMNTIHKWWNYGLLVTTLIERNGVYTMGILSRFKDIMASNINSLLDKCEDPEKMIDQYLRNLESDLGKVKAETASVMAEETRSKRELDECALEIGKFQKYAEKALTSGNEADARQFLEKKQQAVTKQTSLQQMYTMSAENAAKMKQMHEKLVKDIAGLNARRDSIKVKVQVAKTQQKLNQIGSSVTGANNNLSAFDRMEDKAEKMLDEANAMSELNQVGVDNDIVSLQAKYDTQPGNAAVDDELAALKAQMGL